MRISAPGTLYAGRTLQAGYDYLKMVGLALLYPALEWSALLLAIIDIRAHPISFCERP
jgi:hypothetical protein